MNDELQRSATAPALTESFDDVVLPHLDAAYRLARWLMRNEHDAEDVVQDSLLRALRYFRTFTGGDGRAWFLRIVRNTCSGWRDHRFEALTDPFDEEQHRSPRPGTDPETLLLRTDDATLIARTIRLGTPVAPLPVLTWPAMVPSAVGGFGPVSITGTPVRHAGATSAPRHNNRASPRVIRTS